MASADLREDLSCSICLNIYTDPRTLKCGHNFCQVCIDRVLDVQETSGGNYSCPECREEFPERPKLRKNIALCNIAEKLLPDQTQQGPAGTFCTYCIHACVPASKSCVQCEASLCADHLRVHSKSPEHVLLDPSTSLENRKCSVHKELLRYFCVRDSVCICVSCSLAGQHRGHRVDMLEEASKKKKENLRKVMETLASKSKEVKKIVEGLQEEWRKVQENTADIKQRAIATFRDIRSLVDNLEEKVLAEISEQEKQGSQSVSNLIQQLEAKRDGLARKGIHIEELLNMVDPLTVLQDLETSRGDFCDMTHIDDVNLDITHNKVYAVNDLDESPITVKLQTLSGILVDLKCGVCTRGPTKLSLNKNTACNCITVSDDLKSASTSSRNLCHYNHGLVMSTRRFSSGTHYWEVEFGVSGSVGVCYASVSIQGSKIEGNNKSWWLTKNTDRGVKTYFTLMHNNCTSQLPVNVSNAKIRIYLDYEGGQISFYELCTPIQHLHTFTAKFTEPLHAAFHGSKTTFKIN